MRSPIISHQTPRWNNRYNSLPRQQVRQRRRPHRTVRRCRAPRGSANVHTVSGESELRALDASAREELRDVRLRALRSDPDAFESVVADEIDQPAEAWLARIPAGRRVRGD